MSAPIPIRPLLELERGKTGEENMYGGDYSNWSGQLVPLFAPHAAPTPEPIEALQARIRTNQQVSDKLAGRTLSETQDAGVRAVDPTLPSGTADNAQGGKKPSGLGWS